MAVESEDNNSGEIYDWFEGVCLIEDGLLKPRTTRKLNQLQKFLEVHDGEQYLLKIEKLDERPKAKQFRYLYGHVYQVIQDYLINDSGLDRAMASIDNIDNMFKTRYAFVEWYDPLTGEVHKRIKNKREMAKKELTGYINSVTTYAITEWGVSFQDSEDYDIVLGL